MLQLDCDNINTNKFCGIPKSGFIADRRIASRVSISYGYLVPQEEEQAKNIAVTNAVFLEVYLYVIFQKQQPDKSYHHYVVVVRPVQRQA